MDKPLILILCTGNSCRSHLAEGILRAAAAVSGGHGIFLQSHITSDCFAEKCLSSVWRNSANQPVSVLT